MAGITHPFMGKVFVGHPVEIDVWRDKVDDVLMPDELVEMAFKGVRDGMLFTDRRIVVIDAQGIMGRKLALSSFPWRAISAFSVESSGTFDLDAELKICGSGWGVCEVMLTKGTDIREVCRYINAKLFG